MIVKKSFERLVYSSCMILLKIEAQIVHNAAENLGSFVDVVNDYHYSLPFKGSLQKSGDLKSSYCKLKQANATYGLM